MCRGHRSKRSRQKHPAETARWHVSSDEWFPRSAWKGHRAGGVRNGGTALIVSHNAFLVSRLCQKALWLEGGKLLRFDMAQDVCQAYYLYVRKLERAPQGGSGASVQGRRWGSGEIRICSVRVLDSENKEESSFFR